MKPQKERPFLGLGNIWSNIKEGGLGLLVIVVAMVYEVVHSWMSHCEKCGREYWWKAKALHSISKNRPRPCEDCHGTGRVASTD